MDIISELLNSRCGLSLFNGTKCLQPISIVPTDFQLSNSKFDGVSSPDRIVS